MTLLDSYPRCIEKVEKVKNIYEKLKNQKEKIDGKIIDGQGGGRSA
jgi:hypothetical protein